jgi:hypothetical protein
VKADVKRVDLAYDPRAPFIPFHARSQRFAVLVYHRRAGKTVATVNDLVVKALRCKKPFGFFGYIAPYKGQVEQTAWEYLKGAVRDIPGAKILETTKAVEVPSAAGTKATVRLFGADNAEAMRGLYFDGVVLDEVADMKRGVWETVVRPMLSDRLGWAVFIGTPKGKNFFYDLWEAAKKDPKRWYTQLLKASDSGLIDEEELLDVRETLDEESYQQEFECSFIAGIKGNYYGSIIEKMELEGQLEPLDVVSIAPVNVAFDLGISDATAAWFWQVVNGQLRVIDHEEWNDIDIHKIIDDVLKRGYKMGDWWLPHDAKARSLQTGKSMIEQFRARGIAPRAVPDLSINDGIQAVRYTLPKMLINSAKCSDGIEALKNYKKKWNAERQAYQKTPDHDWSSHTADAMRYMCLAVRDKDIAATVTKRQPSFNSGHSLQQWLEQASINTVTDNGMTLDQLFARQPRSSYERI